MFYSKYCLFIINITRVGEKIINRNINLSIFINSLKIKHLEITFRIPSDSKYEHGFITMLMLTEKMTNNKPIFLLDKNTLSRNKTIKIGLIQILKNELVDYYIKLCCMHSIPKFYSYGILFNISNKTNKLSYFISKILSNTLFSLDKDVSSYYDYLGELPYEFNFMFCTFFKHISINKLLISSKGVHFINSFNDYINLQNNEIKEIVYEDEKLNAESNSELDDEFELDEILDTKDSLEQYEDFDDKSDIDLDTNFNELHEILSINDSLNMSDYIDFEIELCTKLYIKSELNNFLLKNYLDLNYLKHIQDKKNYSLDDIKKSDLHNTTYYVFDDNGY